MCMLLSSASLELILYPRFRVQDVRATEKDKVKTFSSFRPGDVVRAQVVCP